MAIGSPTPPARPGRLTTLHAIRRGIAEQGDLHNSENPESPTLTLTRQTEPRQAPATYSRTRTSRWRYGLLVQNRVRRVLRWTYGRRGASSSPWWKCRVAPRRARRPAGQARRPRIRPVFEGGATPPAGMPRPSNAAPLSPRAARSRVGVCVQESADSSHPSPACSPSPPHALNVIDNRPSKDTSEMPVKTPADKSKTCTPS